MEDLARRVARIGGLENDARLRELLDAVPSGIAEIDLDGRLRFGNAAFHGFFDAEPGSLEGSPIWDLARDGVHRATFAAFLKQLHDAPTGTGAHVFRYQAEHGAERHLRLDFSHKRDHDDVLVGYTAVVTDMTQDIARRALENRLRLITDHLPALIAYVDRDERYRFVNAAYRSSYEGEHGELIGRQVEEVLGAETYARIQPFMARTLNGESVSFEIEVPCRIGRDDPCWVLADYVPDISDGKVLGFYALIRDVTVHREAEHLSHEANQLLDVAFNALDVAVAYMDRDFHFIRVNESYARRDKRPVESFPGRKHFELFPDADAERIFRDVLESGQSYHYRARPFEYADASERPSRHWDWSLVPVKHRDGSVFGVVQLLIDVTDRITGLEQIQESEERFRAIFENASDAIIMADESSLKLVMVNDTACRWLGYTRDEFRTLTVRDIHPSESHPEILAQFMLLGAGKIPQAEDIPVLRKDGSVFRADVSAAPVNLGGQRYLCGFFRDATARVETEQAMRQQNRRLEMANEQRGQQIAQQAQMIDQIHDPVIGLELDGTVTSWNSGAQRLFGYTAEEILGHSFSRLVAAKDAARKLRDWFARVETQGELESETTLRRRNGQLTDGLVSFSLLRDAHGEPRGYAAYCLDITVRKEAEQAMKSALESARQASEAKSTFLSRMSHELRTPMNAILGFAQLMELQGELSASQRENVQEIRLAGRHLLGLINDILDLSRIENGRLEVRLEPVNVGELAEEVLQLGRQLARDANVEIESTVRCQCHVQADRLRLRQILLNLVSNGIKYNRDVGRVCMHCHAPADGRVRIEVEDTGVGIAESDRERIFEPFERLHQKADVEGVGIGLALSRQLIELMGGEIGVDSRAGGGSRFWVEFAQAGSG